jgi:predicted Zn-dependent peptidase
LPASDAGLFTAYAGTAPEHAATVLELLEGEVARFVADGPTEEEVAIAIGYLSGSLVLGLEDTGSRLGRLGGLMSALGRVVAVEEDLELLAGVTVDDVRRAADRVLAGPRSVAVVGPLDAPLERALSGLATTVHG